MVEKVLQDCSYGMYVVGFHDAGRLGGCIANAVIQVSAYPASIAVSIHRNNDTCKALANTGAFTLSVLSQDIKPLTIGTFGFFKSSEVEKFSGINYALDESGLPYLTGHCCGWLSCKVASTVESHTHKVFIADITGGGSLEDGIPMTYQYYLDVKKGRTPKNAATYRAAKPAQGTGN